MFFNANGLLGKADEILYFVKEKDVDFCFIVETWLAPNSSTIIKNPFINIINYRNDFIEGGRRAQGGILGFCKSTLQQHILILETTTDYCFIKIEGVIFGVGYFSPSLAIAVLEEFMEKAEAYANENDQKCILVGDFNARMANRTGDSTTNQRGIVFDDMLNDSLFNIAEPSQGKFTTQALNGGRGITDLVLFADINVQNLCIYEENSLGGSDHRPLVFEMSNMVLQHREFQRWNIRKFTQEGVKEKFEAELIRNQNQVLQDIADSPTIDNTWAVVVKWIEKATEYTVGKFEYSSEANKKFWDQRLISQRQTIQEKMRILNRIQNTQAVPVRQHARTELRRLTDELTDLNQKYRRDLIERRTKVFEEIVNKIGDSQNMASFSRMVKTVRNRHNRVACALDSSKMEVHAAYFRQSFNGEPGGEEQFEYPDTNGPSPSISWTDIAHILKTLPLGKAAGVDGIMPEQLAYGKIPMAVVLQKLFTKIIESSTIPSQWKEALIVPVFKKKGSDKEIKNYRPIALTCLARRVYEKCIALQLQKYQEQLSDNQGGFRTSRSTLDQVYFAHELTKANNNLSHVLLDLQTAYDTVNRGILWHRLATSFGVPGPLIKLLQGLFDFNSSKIAIQGKMSEPIQNTRGLLQGSSLSPILFNFFINDLINELEAANIRKPKVDGISANCLFFADDGKLQTMNEQDMQVLLNICESWSNRVGMRFSPTKCYVITDSDETALQLYGQVLPCKKEELYLGVPINSMGINWDSLIAKRTSNARNATSVLSRFGFNGNGWPLEASARVYKAFIRPVMEYGISLRVLEPKQIQSLQKTQNMALRTMFSVPSNTSSNAMMKLAQTPPMKFRNQILNVGFACRLNNSNDGKRPPVKLFRNQIQNRRMRTLASSALKNPLWTRAKKESQLTNRLTLEPRNRTVGRPAYNDEQKRKLQHQTIRLLDDGLDNIAGTLLLEENEEIRQIMRVGQCPKKQRITITRWLLGTITRHEVCKKCNGELTRKHAIECSGALTFLRDLFPEVSEPTEQVRWTLLDNILNTYRIARKNTDFYRNIYLAISKVYTECHGFQQAANGFWIQEQEGIG